MNHNHTTPDVRLDKWLWAARFYKTRRIAKEAIEGGKVHYNGQRSKVSKKVEVGAELTIRQGFDEKTVVVTAIAEQRRGAPEAAKLYSETNASIEKRAEITAARKAGSTAPDRKPDKRDRRKLESFKKHFNQGDV